jgi:4-amino-4-deoxy-L-arabinose transferase-like glycosyltransferase
MKVNVNAEKQTQISSRIPSIFWILILAFFLRILHLASSASNPMTYSPGADETFYLDFGKNVAQGQFGLNAEFVFMDPLYGYFIGFINLVTGENLFVIYFFQILFDVFTVWVVYTISKILWDQRAGLIAALFYALTSTAIFYTTTILKPTLVACYVALWVLLTIRIPKSKRSIAWFGYGCLLGLGIALRSNLLLLTIISFFYIPFSHYINKSETKIFIKMFFLFIGFILFASILATRNKHITDHWSILPPNGGIVLHQIYNTDNPKSVHFVPDFVSYRSPSEILNGYKNEAHKRLGRELSIYEVSDYWRDQALSYITLNPKITFNNILRKSKEFISYKEIGNNRFFYEEAMFSPILQTLPQPFGWLFALGCPGLILLFMRHKTASLPVIFAVIAIFTTFVFFIAAARFRSHGLPLFAIGSGVYIAAILNWKKTGINKTISIIFLSIFLGLISIWNGKNYINETSSLMEFAWGYIKMGQTAQAIKYAQQQIREVPEDAGPYELLGYIALNEKNYQDAILFYSTATQLSPQHHISQYNLALSLNKTKQYEESLVAIDSAINIATLPEYIFLKGQILENMGDISRAIQFYDILINIDDSLPNWLTYANKAKERIDFLKKYY